MPANAADPAAQNRERGLLQSGGAHLLGNAVDELGAHGARRFRRDIALGDAGSSGSDDQLHLLGQPPQSGFNRRLLVGEQLLHG